MSVLTLPVSAHPPTSTDHGLNATTFETLWAGDDDTGNVSEASSAMAALGAGTDVPLGAPPAAVESWNRGEMGDWPMTGGDASAYPSHATLESGHYLKDAYVEIVAIEPSTRAWLSPDRTPLYVAPSGDILGVIDYRVETPANEYSIDRRVTWALLDHRVVETRLLVDGDEVDSVGGNLGPTLSYDGLGDRAGSVHTFTVETRIEVELERTIRIRDTECTTIGNETTCETVWTEQVDAPVEALTVTDSIAVTTYDLTVTGYRAEYPNGDLGLVVFADRPWLGYSLPAGEVNGIWRFFSARDPRWDSVEVRDSSGTTVDHSSLHPLHVHAYPFEPGPTAAPKATVTLLETFGIDVEPPTLPAGVTLDVIEEPYETSYGLVARIETEDHALGSMTAAGLVRGVSTSGEEDAFVDVPINASDLELTVVNTTADVATVQVRLTDVDTGAPINTLGRNGYVLLEGERVDTFGNGTALRTVERTSGPVTARYVPGRWWLHDPGYVGDSAITSVDAPGRDPLNTLFNLLVPVSLFLFAVVIVERFTGWRLWPPWRGV